MSYEATSFILGWIARMSERFGGIVWDTELGRGWDWGQALCRAAYGPAWPMQGIPAVPSEEAVRIAREWEAGKWPQWAVGVHIEADEEPKP